MENYEEKYNALLARLKSMVSVQPDVTKEAIISIFPEIAESDDERVRKFIIKIFKDSQRDGISEEIMPEQYDKIFAYLEKQGEPIEINPSEFDSQLNRLLKQFESLSKEELASSLSFYLNVVQNDGTYKSDEKQGEQKHVNAEPFEIEHGKYYYCIKDYYCGGNKRASKGDVVQALRGLSMMALGDRASEYFLPVNSIEQKQEWSEEDLNKIENALFGTYAVDVATRLLDKIKSLRPQNKKNK